jgi:hypothetical protein
MTICGLIVGLLVPLHLSISINLAEWIACKHKKNGQSPPKPVQFIVAFHHTSDLIVYLTGLLGIHIFLLSGFTLCKHFSVILPFCDNSQTWFLSTYFMYNFFALAIIFWVIIKRWIFYLDNCYSVAIKSRFLIYGVVVFILFVPFWNLFFVKAIYCCDQFNIISLIFLCFCFLLWLSTWIFYFPITNLLDINREPLNNGSLGSKPEESKNTDENPIHICSNSECE